MSSRNSDIRDISKKRYVIRVTMTGRMVALSDNSDILNSVYHTRKKYINIFRNLKKLDLQKCLMLQLERFRGLH
jgi:hypothetical protein